MTRARHGTDKGTHDTAEDEDEVKTYESRRVWLFIKVIVMVLVQFIMSQ